MLFFSAIPTYKKAGELLSQEKPTQVTITNVWDELDDGGPHGSSTTQRYASYSYNVNGINYNGKSEVNSNYNQNGAITIYYEPRNPSISAIDPKSDFTHARLGVIFVIVWIMIVFAIGVAVLVAISRGVQFTSSRYY